MALPAIAMVGASAAGGVASSLLGKKKESVPKYTPHEKRLTGASQALIPYYLNMLTGRDTPFIRRLLAQLKSQGYQMAGQNVQEYLRQIGTRGGADFGPSAYRGIRDIYSQISPTLMSSIAQTRMQGLSQAQQGLQRWSEIKPGTDSQPKGPSTASQAGAGALQGLGRFLGTKAETPQVTKQSTALSGPPLRGQAPGPSPSLSSLISQVTGLNRFLPGGVPGF